MYHAWLIFIEGRRQRLAKSLSSQGRVIRAARSGSHEEMERVTLPLLEQVEAISREAWPTSMQLPDDIYISHTHYMAGLREDAIGAETFLKTACRHDGEPSSGAKTPGDVVSYLSRGAPKLEEFSHGQTRTSYLDIDTTEQGTMIYALMSAFDQPLSEQR